MSIADVFSVRLKALREAIGANQGEFAERIGVTRQSISLYEKGERVPDIGILERIYAETFCSVRYLLGLQESMSDQLQKLKSPDTALSDNALLELMLLSDPEAVVFNVMTAHDSFHELLKYLSVLSSGEQARSFENPCFSSGYFEFKCHQLLDEIIKNLKEHGENALSDSERQDIEISRRALENESRKEMQKIYDEAAKSCPAELTDVFKDWREKLYGESRYTDKFAKFQASMTFPMLEDE